MRCGASLLAAGSADLDGPHGRPCVVMAHGFGCTRDSGLARFAERFAAAGAEVLLFDYRGFGTSAGTPRQYVSHRRQRQDWAAAVAAARRLGGVDPARIVLWGTSYAGGHVLATAALDARIAGVIAQGAAVDGLALLRKPERADPSAPRSKGARMALAAVRDLGHAALRRRPLLLQAVGAPGEHAMLTDAANYRDYLAMMGPTWRNEVCARSLLTIPFNRPIRHVGAIACPVLLVIAERDTVTPAASIRDAGERTPDAQVLAFDTGHFGIYAGPAFEQSVAAQVEFLRRVTR